MHFIWMSVNSFAFVCSRDSMTGYAICDDILCICVHLAKTVKGKSKFLDDLNYVLFTSIMEAFSCYMLDIEILMRYNCR